MPQSRLVRLSLVLLLLEDAWSIRNVKLTVEPPTVIRGGTAALKCERDMQGFPLYAVKWYRGNHEFYRYTPSEKTKYQMFEVPGIFVDMHHSDGDQVTLHRMALTLAGNFSCEVTADAPYFSTIIVGMYIDIIALPERVPILVTEKQHYQPGDILKANCTASPSKPAANLTIFVNGLPLTSSETQLHQMDNGFQWTAAHADLLLTADLFPGGRLGLRCLAKIYEVYSDVATVDLFMPEVDPRPEKIMLPNGSSAISHHCLHWFLLLALVFFVCSSTNGDEYFNEDTYFDGDFKEFDPKDDEDAMHSLGV